MSGQTLFEIDDTLTVGQITRRLGEAVRKTFPNEVWVQGQIRNLSRSARGHVYFDLVDPVAAGSQPKAAIAVTLFDSNRQIVNRIITRTGNAVRIDDGIEVRIRAAFDFYAPRGQVQLNMTSIDPEFTLGRLGADRELLLRQLEVEQLVEANAHISLPLVPLRIALVTSDGSAAHADFVQQLAASAYAFVVTTLPTRVQGEYAPEEIADSIRRADQHEVDVVAVVRGGGARTDLAAFDTEPVARAIATASKPVLCGIGHEIDTTVADLVAYASFKTPTACAQFLIEQVISFDVGLAERWSRLVAAARSMPSSHATRVDAGAQQIVQLVERSLHLARQRNSRAAQGLERGSPALSSAATSAWLVLSPSSSQRVAMWSQSSRRRCERYSHLLADLPADAVRTQQRRLDLLEARLSAVDPVQALRRGYSITTVADGSLVRSHSRDIEPGTVLVTRLADGSVTSTTTDSKPDQDLP